MTSNVTLKPLKLQQSVNVRGIAGGSLPLVCREAAGGDSGAFGRTSDSLGGNSSVGGLGADSLTLLDGGIVAPHGPSAYHHPPYHFAVLR